MQQQTKEEEPKVAWKEVATYTQWQQGDRRPPYPHNTQYPRRRYVVSIHIEPRRRYVVSPNQQAKTKLKNCPNNTSKLKKKIH
jgi:hypothetical protein